METSGLALQSLLHYSLPFDLRHAVFPLESSVPLLQCEDNSSHLTGLWRGPMGDALWEAQCPTPVICNPIHSFLMLKSLLKSSSDFDCDLYRFEDLNSL